MNVLLLSELEECIQRCRRLKEALEEGRLKAKQCLGGVLLEVYQAELRTIEEQLAELQTQLRRISQ